MRSAPGTTAELRRCSSSSSTEDPGQQARSEGLFSALAADAPEMEAAADYARRHAEVINRFGRFPSRNAALGRESTDEERAFLADHPEGF
jgi:uncharacterized protein (DUF924 family)